jgi:hypothetical protein
VRKATTLSKRAGAAQTFFGDFDMRGAVCKPKRAQDGGAYTDTKYPHAKSVLPRAAAAP